MINKTIVPHQIGKWFSSLVEDSHFKTKWIKLSDSKEWCLDKGEIRHNTGRFFSLIGIEFKDVDGRYKGRPLIKQLEIGLLGFLVKKTKKGLSILVQAKIEPGNKNIIQLAPTCQATKSNLLRLHGGMAPPFSDIFKIRSLKIINSSLQSEQGTKFYGKRNRNVLALYKNISKLPLTHKYMNMDDFLKMLAADYLVNTDARSVLVCSLWRFLVKRKPFTRYSSVFAKELMNSYAQKASSEVLNVIKEDMNLLRKNKHSSTVVPLEKLRNWVLSDSGLTPKENGPYRVRYIDIHAENREVPEWDQPIIDCYGKGKIDLIFGRINGIIHFHFKPVFEPGLYSKVELSPTVCIEPGEKDYENYFRYIKKFKTILTVNQSDEGGRFYKNVSQYRILDIGNVNRKLSGYWLNLAEIQSLALKGSWFTNEARSAISLLLYWL